MILYLTKVILCSAAFWAFYRLVLQREQMFGFNRIYLLLTPILAVFIPFYQIEVLVPSVADAPVMMLPASSGSVIMESVEPSWTIWDYACALYLLVAAMLLIRLLINLMRIMHSTRQAKTYQWRDKTIVTLPKEVVPYSFLDYIFISENATDQETLLQHEYAHSRQWHSADILVIEVLQIIFWCNPVLHLYRRSMRLNHEFLADAATINHTSIKDYQRLLLQVATAHDKHYLASGFNYFFIKNRLEMMTKTTSTVRRRVLQSLAALLLVVMTFFAAEWVYAQSKNESAAKKEISMSSIDDKIIDAYSKYGPSGLLPYLKDVNKIKLDNVFVSREEVSTAIKGGDVISYMITHRLPKPDIDLYTQKSKEQLTDATNSIGHLNQIHSDKPKELLKSIHRFGQILLDFEYITRANARDAIKSGEATHYSISNSGTSSKLNLYTSKTAKDGKVPPQPSPSSPKVGLSHMMFGDYRPVSIMLDGVDMTEEMILDLASTASFDMERDLDNNAIHIVNVKPLGDNIPQYIFDMGSYLDEFDGYYLKGKEITKKEIIDSMNPMSDRHIKPVRIEKLGAKKYLHCREQDLRDLMFDNTKPREVHQDIAEEWRSWLSFINKADSKNDIYFINGEEVSLNDMNKIDISQYKAFYAGGEYDFENIRSVTRIELVKK